MISLFSTLLKFWLAEIYISLARVAIVCIKIAKILSTLLTCQLDSFVLFILFTRFDWRFDNLICFCSSINIESLTYLFSRCVLCFILISKVFNNVERVRSLSFPKIAKYTNPHSFFFSSLSFSLTHTHFHSNALHKDTSYRSNIVSVYNRIYT